MSIGINWPLEGILSVKRPKNRQDFGKRTCSESNTLGFRLGLFECLIHVGPYSFEQSLLEFWIIRGMKEALSHWLPGRYGIYNAPSSYLEYRRTHGL